MQAAVESRSTRRKAMAFVRIQARFAAIKRRKIVKARTCPNAFFEYVMRSEETNKPVKNAEIHLRWNRHRDKHKRVIIIAPVEHGKTAQAVSRSLWELGKNPFLRIAIVQCTRTMAMKSLGNMREHIETNERLREVFPDLDKNTKGMPWRDSMFFLERDTFAKDPSVQACGAYGAINGSRVDLLMVDDLLDYENTRNPDQLKKMIEWFDAVCQRRVTKKGRIWVIGTPWTRDDLLAVLSARSGFALLQIGAVENPDDSPKDWIPVWPEEWTLERILDAKENTLADQFAQTILCKISTDQNSRFQKAWFEAALRAGQGLYLVSSQPNDANGWPMQCFTGVDLGIGQTEDHDETWIVTIGLDERKRRRVVNIQHGRWLAPDIVARVKATQMRFHSVVNVESNQGQEFIAAFARGDGFSITSSNTDAKKWDQKIGIEGVAIEMKNGMWVYPSGELGQEVDHDLLLLRQGCEDFKSDVRVHTPDCVMAVWLAWKALTAHVIDRFSQENHMAR